MKLYVLLDSIRSAYNVGSIFRTCDSAGVDQLFLAGFTAFPPHSKLQKTALGSTNNVNWEHHCDAFQLTKYLKLQQIQIICLETSPSAQPIFDYTYNHNSCLILGNEEQGIDPRILNLADSILKIPQYGVKESLNVASAAAVAIYEFRRQSLKLKP